MKKETHEMRLHPALLALGLIVAAGLACNFSVGNVNNGNVATNTNAAANTGPASNSGNASASNTSGGMHVNDLYTAKSSDGDATKSFGPSDRTVYVVATLSDAKAGTKVTFTWYGVNVEGHSNNSKVQEVEYTTGPNENKVTAHLTAPEDWPKGSYRVETEVNGKPDKSVEYTVE